MQTAKAFRITVAGLVLAAFSLLTPMRAQAFLYPQMFSPINATERKEQADAAFALRQWDKAVMLYTDALNTGDLPPKQKAIAYENRGRCRLAVNKPHQALADFRRSIEVFPGRASAFAARALAWQGIGALEQAVQDAHRALKLAPDNVEALSIIEK